MIIRISRKQRFGSADQVGSKHPPQTALEG